MRLRIALLAIAVVGCAGDLGLTDDPRPPHDEPDGGCAIECHGDDNSNAPPKSVSGAVETTAVAVGAHQVHLDPLPAWHHRVECADCHVVPTSVDSPGHIDGDNKAEVMGPRIESWDGTTCTSKCHGSAALGGTKSTPIWTQVDGTQSQCGSCHGAPPPAPHPTGAEAANCATCHPTMEENSLVFRNPDSHINGTVEVTAAPATGGCTSCHGREETNAAPPLDLTGNAARTSLGVGAHQEHLKTSTWRHAIPCSACHVVPTALDSPGHRDGDNKAEVKFDTMNPQGTYANGTCSTMYCHGNGRGSTGSMSWLATGPLQCGACHSVTGTGMSGDHARHLQRGITCSQCHATVVDANRNIITADLHIDGKHEVKMAAGTWNVMTRSCSGTGCHNTKRWETPRNN